MSYRREILQGYTWSLLSPLVVTFCVSVFIGLADIRNKSILYGIDTFFATFFFLGIISFLFSSVVCALVVVPAYYFSRTTGYANIFVISASGGLAGYGFSVSTGQVSYYTILYIVYGVATGWFFWVGSKKVR